MLLEWLPQAFHGVDYLRVQAFEACAGSVGKRFVTRGVVLGFSLVGACLFLTCAGADAEAQV